MLLLKGMGAGVPAAPGRNEAEDQRRRDAGLVGQATRTPPPGEMMDEAGSWLSEHKLMAGIGAAVVVGGFLIWRQRR